MRTLRLATIGFRLAAAVLGPAFCAAMAQVPQSTTTTAEAALVPAHAVGLLALKGHAQAEGVMAYPFGAIRVSAIWRRPGWTAAGDKPIDVCWEQPDDAPAYLRDAVRDAVARTWAHHGMVSFRGWGACAVASQGIRIAVSTGGSGTLGLGQELDGRPGGMRLQMDFSASTHCLHRNEFCVRATAVHEFGHALGLVHEQNRPDAPGWCKVQHQGIAPDKLVTPFDDLSIMNYCNTKWQNDGLLSDRDIETVTTLYGARA